ncbi:fasciclin domain-containing protein [bacterium]|nr:MAG: fasciclin domain-containing protein [bacterium]
MKIQALVLGVVLSTTLFANVSPSNAQGKNIVATAQSTGMFKTLIAAATAAGLGPTLTNGGPFTVFAPTDEAFKKLPAGTVENLLKPENKATLASILKYHVVSGRVPASAVMKLPSGTNVETVNGEKVIIRMMDGKVMLDPGMGGKATVIKTDVMASNGIVHVIDSVILPPTVQRAMMGAG